MIAPENKSILIHYKQSPTQPTLSKMSGDNWIKYHFFMHPLLEILELHILV